MSDVSSPLGELGGPAGFTEFIDLTDGYWEQTAPPFGASLSALLVLQEEQDARDAENRFWSEWRPLLSVAAAGIPNIGPPTPVPGQATFQKGVPFIRSGGSTRQRQHEEAISRIVNSLIRQGIIKFVDAKEVALGYKPSNPQDWAPGAPETMQEAYDRLAAAVKLLGGNP